MEKELRPYLYRYEDHDGLFLRLYGHEISLDHLDEGEQSLLLAEPRLSVHAQSTPDELTSAKATIERLVGALETARASAYAAPELNMSNYDHDQVDELNKAMIDVFQTLDEALSAAKESKQ